MPSKDIIRDAIKTMMQQYPGISQMEIAERLGIGRNTVNKHVQAIRASWRSEDME